MVNRATVLEPRIERRLPFFVVSTRMRLMKNHIGFGLQFLALVFLPVLIIFQLNFGFKLLYMPLLALAGLGVFYIGHMLRDRAS